MTRAARIGLNLSARQLLLIGVIAALGALGGVAVAVGMNHQKAALTIALFPVTLLPMIIRSAQRRFDPFEPIQVVSLTFFLLYAIRPMTELLSNMQTFFNKPTQEAFVPSAGVAIVGILAIYFGYAIGAGRSLAGRLPSLPDHWEPRRALRFALYTLAFAALLTAAFAATVGPGTLLKFYLGRTNYDYLTFLEVSGYVGLGPYLTIPVVFMLLYVYRDLRTWKVLALLLGTLAVALYITVPRGDRTYILILVLPLLVLWFMVRGKRPSAAGSLLTILVAIIGMNVLVAIRHVDTRHNVLSQIGHSLITPFSQLRTFAKGADMAEFSVLELEYQALHSKSSGAKFHPLSTAVALAAYPLPRKIIGQNKPKSAGEYISPILFPKNDPRKRASFNSGMFGDEFADYGWITLIGYSVVIGVAIRALWEYYQRNPKSEGLQIVLAASLPMLVVMIRNGEIDALGRSLFQIGPLVLCLIVASRPAIHRMAGFRSRVDG